MWDAPPQEWNCLRGDDLHFIENPEENNEMGAAQFHWKPLGKQWNGGSDILNFIHSDTITYMKWIMKLPIMKLKWPPVSSISLKSLRKTMKWGLLNFIENLWENNGMEDFNSPISSPESPITSMKLHRWNYIDEMTNEIGEWNFIENR